MTLKKHLLTLSMLLAASAVPYASRAAWAGAGATQDAGRGVRVTITEQGLNPGTVMLRRKMPSRLTFVRETADTCATEINVEELDIHVALPLNEPVTVDVTPARSGKFEFGCGTGKFRGVIVIQ